MKNILIFLSVILLSSCVGLTNISTPQTVALNQGNFRFLKTVSASTSAFYFLGIGGLSNEANTDVVEKLIVEAGLQPNQALVDLRIKTTRKCFLGVVFTRTLTASASVVEFVVTANGVFMGTGDSGGVSDADAERQAKLKRLIEINKCLSSSSSCDIEALGCEFADIERWYDRNGCYSPVEWSELKNAKESLQKVVH